MKTSTSKSIAALLYFLLIVNSFLIAQNSRVAIIDLANNQNASFQSELQIICSPDTIAYYDSLITGLSNYEIVFLFLNDRELNNKHLIQLQEGQQLQNYIHQGGNLYIMGYILKQDTSAMSFWNYLSISSWGAFHVITDFDSITGVPNTIAAGLKFGGFQHFECGGLIHDSLNVILQGWETGQPIMPMVYNIDKVNSKIFIDLFDFAYEPLFLERVCQHFGLISINEILTENTNNNAHFTIKNYPNPFNHTTKIKFSLNRSDYVNVTIYNSAGKKIIELLNNFKKEGNHSVVWNAGNSNNNEVSSGIYFYRISIKNKTYLGKMLLLK